MIARLAGILINKQPPLMVIDIAGVGYEVEVPLTVFDDLPETGQPVVILTHLSIKDDSHTLYGFSSEAQRTLFRQLLKISGIGAKLALTILSGVSADELARYVADNDTASLTRLPGIGKKTATVLLERFGSLDGIYENLDNVHEVNVRGAKTLGEKLTTYRDDAILSRKLTGIACDAPIDDAENSMQRSRPKLGDINALYDEADIGTALRRQAERISDLARD